jgi:hypothetical protein
MVGGIRQRTGTLLAAQALVASFLGGTAIKDYGFHALGWLAVLALLMGLVVAAVVLAPWRLKFAVNARDLYEQVYRQAREEADLDSLRWLAAVGFGYQDLRLRNARSVRWLSRLSAGSVS